MITLIPLPDIYTIYQFSDKKAIPSEILTAGFYSVTSTEEEISIVTNCSTKFPGLKANEGWKGFRVEGVVDFSLIGIINTITSPLKEHKISVFVISTWNTDYVFVKEDSFDQAIEALKNSRLVTIKIH
jgi:hypothetical protein